MTNFRITVAYDGTAYVGWQRQASGVSIQGLLEAALAEFEAGEVAVAGAGRTDAGVHALGQVASFSLARSIDPQILVRALNAKLPADVRVLAATEAASSFHARFDAYAKTYRYRICHGDVVLPFERRYVWHLPGALDIDAMDRAARLLEGTHDFVAFQAAGSDPSSTTRTIYESRMMTAGPVRSIDPARMGESSPAIACLHIRGDGFLRHMVRAIAGSLVEVGRGRRDPAWIRAVIDARDRAQAGRTAPAEGLFLVGVDYVK